MSAQEFGAWQVLYQMEPWGEEAETLRQSKADFRAGIIASTIANVHRGKDTPAYKPSDFMPFLPKAEAQVEESSDPTEFLNKLKNNG